MKRNVRNSLNNKRKNPDFLEEEQNQEMENQFYDEANTENPTKKQKFEEEKPISKQNNSREKVDIINLPPKITESSERTDLTDKGNIVGGVALGLGAVTAPFVPIVGIFLIAFGIAMLRKNKGGNITKTIETGSEKIIYRDRDNEPELDIEQKLDIEQGKQNYKANEMSKHLGQEAQIEPNKSALNAQLSPMPMSAELNNLQAFTENKQNIQYDENIINNNPAKNTFKRPALIEDLDEEMNLITPIRNVADSIAGLMKSTSEEENNKTYHENISHNSAKNASNNLGEASDKEMNLLHAPAKNLADALTNLVQAVPAEKHNKALRNFGSRDDIDEGMDLTAPATEVAKSMTGIMKTSSTQSHSSIPNSPSNSPRNSKRDSQSR